MGPMKRLFLAFKAGFTISKCAISIILIFTYASSNANVSRSGPFTLSELLQRAPSVEIKGIWSSHLSTYTDSRYSRILYFTESDAARPSDLTVIVVGSLDNSPLLTLESISPPVEVNSCKNHKVYMLYSEGGGAAGNVSSSTYYVASPIAQDVCEIGQSIVIGDSTYLINGSVCGQHGRENTGLMLTTCYVQNTANPGSTVVAIVKCASSSRKIEIIEANYYSGDFAIEPTIEIGKAIAIVKESPPNPEESVTSVSADTIPPNFPGGEKGLHEYIAKVLKYPEDEMWSGLQGRVYVAFVIEADGSVSNISIAKGASEGFDIEAMNVVRFMPTWQPATLNGAPVSMRLVLPITFRLR